VVKPWEARFENADALQFIKTRREELKHAKNVRPEREKVEFLDRASTADKSS
jgi:hypothetical protein